MALQPTDLSANAKVTIGGSEGHIIQTDSLLTFVAREDGTVDLYTTDHVRDDADVWVDPEAPQESSADQQRIAQLESELAAARAGSSSSISAAPASTEQTSAPANPAVTPVVEGGRQQTL